MGEGPGLSYSPVCLPVSPGAPLGVSPVTKAGSAGESRRRCRLATRTARRIQLIWVCPGKQLPACYPQTPRDRCLTTSTYFHFRKPHVLGEFQQTPRSGQGGHFLPILPILPVPIPFLEPYLPVKNLQTSLGIPGSAASQEIRGKSVHLSEPHTPIWEPVTSSSVHRL